MIIKNLINPKLMTNIILIQLEIDNLFEILTNHNNQYHLIKLILIQDMFLQNNKEQIRIHIKINKIIMICIILALITIIRSFKANKMNLNHLIMHIN